MNSWLNLLSDRGLKSRKFITSSKGMGATTSKFRRLSKPCTTLVFSALVLFNRGPFSTRSNLPSILTAVIAEAVPAGTENFSSTGPLMATLVKLYLMAVMWSWPVWQGITVRWACIQKQILLSSHCVLVWAFFVSPAADGSFVIATKLHVPQHWYKKQWLGICMVTFTSDWLKPAYMNRVVMVIKLALCSLHSDTGTLLYIQTARQKNYNEAHINNTHVTKQKFLLKPSATN